MKMTVRFKVLLGLLIPAVFGTFLFYQMGDVPSSEAPSVYSAPPVRIVETPSNTATSGNPSSSSPQIGTPKDAVALTKSRNALTFDSAPDLYALATSALSSNNTQSLYDGWQAATACNAVVHSRGHYEQMAQKSLSRPITEEQSKAALTLLQRCRGFFDNDRSAISEMRSRLRERTRNDGGLFFPAASQIPATATQFKAILERSDWAALSLMSHDIIPKILAANGISQDSTDFVYVNAALAQTSCDLGRDCSANDTIYLLNCADGNRCAGSVSENAVSGLSPSELEKVAAWRAQLVVAIGKRDLKYFGY